MIEEKHRLSLIWLVLGVLLAGLGFVHPTHATSPDSVHYLRMATDFRTYDGAFPPGYPFLIAFISYLTQLPVLWASKLVNWLALGVSGVCWARRIGSGRAAGLLALWLLPGALRVAAYTWSETVFVVLLLEAVWQAHSVWYWQGNTTDSGWASVQLAGLAVALIMVRYVGLFVLIGLAGLIIGYQPKGSLGTRMLGRANANRRGLTWALLGAGVGVGLLLVFNYTSTGHWVGGPRLAPTDPWPQLLKITALGFANEVFLYNYRPGVNWVGFGLAILMQGSVCLFLYRNLNRRFRWPPITSLATWMAATGLLYWLILIILRILSPFDPLTERLMMPGSHCVLVAVVLALGQSQHSMMSKSPERAEIRTNPS